SFSNATAAPVIHPLSLHDALPIYIDKLPWDEIDIFHAHTLCESLADGSVGLIEHVAREFAPYIRKVKAVNFGGGHFINKPGYDRSEEHTSELQSRENLVCRLLLEK